MANAITKFGLAALGAGLLSFMALFYATGGVGPCADDSQLTTLFWSGIAALVISGSVFLVSIIAVLLRKHKKQLSPDSLALRRQSVPAQK